MAKLTLDNLVEDAAQTAARERRAQDERNAASQAAQLVRAECGYGFAATLLTLARFDAVFDGVPRSIPLGSDNGYLQGLAAYRDGHCWRLSASHDVFRHLDGGEGRSIVLVVTARRVIEATGRLRDQQSVNAATDRLVAAARDGFADPAALNDIFAKVLPHTAVAAAGRMRRTLSAIDHRLNVDAADWIDAAWRRADLFAMDTQPLPLVLAATDGDVSTIQSLLNAVPPVGMQRAPLMEFHKAEASEAAARAGQEGALAFLLEAGAQPREEPSPGLPLLHTVVDRLDVRFGVDDRGVIATLLEHGFDPERVDCHGYTAASLLRSRLDDAEWKSRAIEACSLLRLLEEGRPARFSVGRAG